MAKKAELLEKAKELKLEVTEKNTIAEIEAAIQKADSATPEVAPQEAPAEETEAEKFTKAGKHSKKATEEAISNRFIELADAKGIDIKKYYN